MRFRLNHSKRKVHTKLFINGEIVEDTSLLLDAWSQHYANLSKSKREELPLLQKLESHISNLDLQSYSNNDSILDVPFTFEEVQNVLRKLKRGKSPGQDKIMAEHLLESGDAVAVWLEKIFNAIVTLETLPDSLKSVFVIPVYKGNGRDPLLPDSYRGITLSSVMSKVLEKLVHGNHGRLEMNLMEANIPHLNQSAYCKKVSCADAIFATQETIARYVRQGSHVFMCLYDLEKAFDTVEYPILLERRTPLCCWD